ncbi:MAG: hypothetical protein ACKVW3_15140 [Phycisphaerales bacterium]
MKVANLAEAEGRALRAGSIRVAISAGLALAGGLLVCGGVGIVAWGVFELIRPHLGTGGAALLCGTVVLAIGAGLLWKVSRDAE